MYGLRARKGRYKEHSLILWRTVMADSEGWVWTVKPGEVGVNEDKTPCRDFFFLTIGTYCH